jgi:CRISPR-associated protein (Cas_Cmr3)
MTVPAALLAASFAFPSSGDMILCAFFIFSCFGFVMSWVLRPYLEILYSYISCILNLPNRTNASSERNRYSELSEREREIQVLYCDYPICFWQAMSTIAKIILRFSALISFFLILIIQGPRDANIAVDDYERSLFIKSFSCASILPIIGCIVYIFSSMGLQKAKGELQALRDYGLKITDATDRIVYFRAFQDDNSWGRLGLNNPVPMDDLRPSMITYDPLPLNITDEERLITQIGEVCEVYAIGRQREPQPPVGARRMYFQDSEWQKAAKEFMRISSFVLFRPQMTQWLLWELGQIAEICRPEQLILWVPSDMTVKQWNLFRKEAKLHCGIEFPEFTNKETALLTQQFLLFGDDWKYKSPANFTAKSLQKELLKLIR